MATDVAPATREVLAARDTQAWTAYAEACHDPTLTGDRRRDLFEEAMESLEALHDFDRHGL